MMANCVRCVGVSSHLQPSISIACLCTISLCNLRTHCSRRRMFSLAGCSVAKMDENGAAVIGRFTAFLVSRVELFIVNRESHG